MFYRANSRGPEQVFVLTLLEIETAVSVAANLGWGDTRPQIADTSGEQDIGGNNSELSESWVGNLDQFNSGIQSEITGYNWQNFDNPEIETIARSKMLSDEELVAVGSSTDVLILASLNFSSRVEPEITDLEIISVTPPVFATHTIPTDAGGNNVYDVSRPGLRRPQHRHPGHRRHRHQPQRQRPASSPRMAAAPPPRSRLPRTRTAVTTVTATDADAGATLTYSIAGGADAQPSPSMPLTGRACLHRLPRTSRSPTDAGGNNVYDVSRPGLRRPQHRHPGHRRHRHQPQRQRPGHHLQRRRRHRLGLDCREHARPSPPSLPPMPMPVRP